MAGVLKRAGLREQIKDQFRKLMNTGSWAQIAAESERGYFKYLIPRKPCSKSRDRRWSEIRDTLESCSICDPLSLYSLVHACSEYGHEVLLRLLVREYLNAVEYFSRSVHSIGDMAPLVRAVIGHENGIKVPFSISRILLDHGHTVSHCIRKEGLYYTEKTRSPPKTLYELAKEGKWPWPETRDLVLEKGRLEGLS